jgi:hypothetical protein
VGEWLKLLDMCEGCGFMCEHTFGRSNVFDDRCLSFVGTRKRWVGSVDGWMLSGDKTKGCRSVDDDNACARRTVMMLCRLQ